MADRDHAAPLGAGFGLVARIPRLVASRSGGPYAPPFKLKLFVTKRCDLACRTCKLWSHDAVQPELNTEEIQAVLRGAARVRILSVSGGEPCLRTDLGAILASAFALAGGPRWVSLNTSGSRPQALVQAVVQALRAAGPGDRLTVQISLDGDPDTHDRIRGKAGAHELAQRAWEGLARISDPRLAVRWNICVSPLNLEQVSDLTAGLAARGEPFLLTFYQVSSHYDHTAEHRDLATGFGDRLATHLASWPLDRLAGDWIGREFLLLEQLHLERPDRQLLPCYSGFASVNVGPHGDVFPCINHPVSMGNMKEAGFDLDGLLRAPQARAVRQRIRQGACPGCWTPNEAYPTMVANLLSPGFYRAHHQARSLRSQGGLPGLVAVPRGDGVDLSVVVPVFNERECLEDNLAVLAGWLEGSGRSHELLVVDDGSTDGSRAVLNRLAQRIGPLRVLGYAPNRGRGHALRHGLRAARGDVLLTTESDLSWALADLEALVARVEAGGVDLAVASPYSPGGRLEGVPWSRRALSRAANLLGRPALGAGVGMATGMTRAYRRAALLTGTLSPLDGKAFHPDTLGRAVRRGLRIAEVPATLTWRRGPVRPARRGDRRLPGATVLAHLLVFGRHGLARLGRRVLG